MEWRDNVDQLLSEGEREQQRLELASATIVVTTHRVLAFTSAIDGADYRAIDRPNVRTVTVDDDADHRSAGRALAAGVVGVGLVGAGLIVDASGVVDSLGAGNGSGPAGGVVDATLATVETLLSAFELALLGSGLVVLVLGTFFALQYSRSRSRELVLTIAGDENLVLPLTDEELEGGVVATLDAAIQPNPAASDDGAGRPDQDDGSDHGEP